MALTPYIKRRAEYELFEAAEWYQNRANLGLDFLRESTALLDVLCETPLLFAEYEGEVRRALLKRFPYAVYYQVESSRLIVHAVLHMKRHPGSWR